MLGAALSVLIAAASCASAPAGSDTSQTSAQTVEQSSTTTPPPRPKLSEHEGSALVGVFRGTRKEEVNAFNGWLGRPVDAVVDFAAADTWQQIADPGYLLDHWAGTPYRLVLSVPMRPIKEASDPASAAAGAYDAHFKQLGTTLVKRGYADASIRLGWEFNMSVSYSYSTDPTAFIEQFRRYVAALRSVEGQRFTVIWNPGSGEQQQDAATFYPGDDVVDVIGLDIYDVGYHQMGYPYPNDCSAECRRTRSDFIWNNQLYGGIRGLAFWANAAREHKKPLALPEWGLWSSKKHSGGDDNPHFIDRMRAFIDDPANRVVLQAYFDWDNPEDRHALSSFPQSGASFRKYWGQEK